MFKVSNPELWYVMLGDEYVQQTCTLETVQQHMEKQMERCSIGNSRWEVIKGGQVSKKELRVLYLLSH